MIRRASHSTGTASFNHTPFDEEEEENQHAAHMSLDRSPSPNRDGGWSSPGLVTSPTGEQSNGRLHGKGKRYIAELNGGVGVGSNVTWESARANSARVNGSVYTSYQQGQNQNQGRGYFSRHLKRVSSGLPAFYQGGRETRYAEKEKLGRGRIPGSLFSGWRHWRLRDWREVPRRLAWMLSRRRKLVAVVMLFVLGIVLMNNKSEHLLLCLSLKLERRALTLLP